MVAAAFYAVFIARTRFVVDGVSYFSLFDDAMISMRYARNLASGLGPVWNPGDPPIEGFTNPLWTGWMAVLHLLGLPEAMTSLAVMVSGALLLLGGAWLAGRIARQVAPDAEAVARVSVWATAFCYPLVYWTLRGFEVGLLAALVGASVLAVYQVVQTGARRWLVAAALLLATLPLVRADGIVPAGELAASVFLWGLPRRQLAPGLVLLLAVAVSAGLQTAARLAIFGDPLPNTYYLKMTGVALSARVGRGAWMLVRLVAIQLWPLLLLAALNGRRLLRWPFAPLTGLVAAQLAYSVYVGGDAWEWMDYANRYVSAALPALIVLSAVGAYRLRARPDPALRTLVLGGLAAGVVLAVLASSSLWRADAGPSFDQGSVHRMAFVAWCELAEGLLALALGTWALARWRVSPETLERARARLDRWGEPRLALAVTVIQLAWLSGGGVGRWALTGGEYVSADADHARTGVLLSKVTAPDASIAVVGAGAIPYFSQRRAIDLMGKSDRHIAREPGRGRFAPGHNKWDYAYSIGSLRPDVIIELWRPEPADFRLIAALGYTPAADGMLIAPWARWRHGDEIRRPSAQLER